jgi:hypothetical protein
MQGARHDPLLLTWKYVSGIVKDLGGATITATMTPAAGGTTRAVTGVFAVTGDGSAGEFTWTLSEDDVGTTGEFIVQFKAAWADGTYALSEDHSWLVRPARTVPAP